MDQARTSTMFTCLYILFAFNCQLSRPAPTDSTSGDILSELDRSASLQDEPIRRVHYHFEKQMNPYMQLYKFNNTSYNGNTVTCNDGSTTGYYKRLNNHSKSWIIYLQGGGFCASDEACRQRWRRSPHLMSSNYWQKLKSVDGILSSEPKDNPFLWNANHIYVPYCSSDSWSGLQHERSLDNGAGNGDASRTYSHELTDDMSELAYRATKQAQPHRSPAFMGSSILERVFESLFEELPRDSSLYEAKFILLAGDSAGATGVILNLDRLNKFVQLKFAALRQNCSRSEPGADCENSKQAPVFRGLADSGWFLDNEPYDSMDQYSINSFAFGQPSMQQQTPHRSRSINPSGFANPAAQYVDETDANQSQQQTLLDCDRQRCNPLQSIHQAMLYWNGQVPASCAHRYQLEPWRCYFGYRVHQTLKTPLFVVQWLYDEAQLIVDNIGRPDTVSQWNYVNKLVNDMRASLDNVTALFAPSCLSHSLITKQAWNHININGFKLPHILNSWEEETLANQPTLETLLSPLSASMATTNGPENLELSTNHNNQQMVQAPSSTFRSTNQQQQPVTLDTRMTETNSSPKSLTSRTNRSRKRKRNNQHQKPSGQSQSNRLGRSTAIIVESESPSTILNNNVPDIFSISATSRHQQESGEKFRHIDSCGWPQCNRDCPILEQEFSPRSILNY